jgi:cation diffusion facilitator family transporter
MSPQRRTALASVVAAAVLIVVKLVAGLASGSLGLLSEAIHSGTDLVAALLTFFAVGVAGRPADRSHPYGHDKAEHLSALAEAAILVVASLVIVWQALARLTGEKHPDVDAAWWTFAVIGVVIAIDLSRAVLSVRAARRYGSPALAANALHFAGDLGGSAAVLLGLLLVRAGYPGADSAAALFVAALVLIAAGRLMRQNVDVLMDRSPAAAQATARRAIAELDPAVDLRRLRLREAAGRHFADVVIGVEPGAVVAEGHAVADAIEEALERALPGSDVVVHVEPHADVDTALRERALAAALRVPRVREIHNVTVLRIGDRAEVTLHLKLPGDISLDEAHGIASAVESAIAEALPEVDSVQTHLEPLAEPAGGVATAPFEVEPEREKVERIVREATGRGPRELRFLRTDEGLVVFLTLGVDAELPLAAAHARASDVEDRIRRERLGIADVIVHTEPGELGGNAEAQGNR